MNSVLQYVLYVGILVAFAIPLGFYMSKVMDGEKTIVSRVLGPVERGIYRLLHIDPEKDMGWKKYLAAALLFNLFGFIVLLLILLFLGPLTKHIPMACLAGVLIIVSYNMSEWRTFRSLMKNPKSDVSVLLVTFFLTVIFDLTIAIEIGLLIAMLFFMRRVAETTHVSVTTDEIDLSDEGEIHHDEEVLQLEKGIEVYEIDGPFFFGVANKFDSVMKNMGDKPKIRIIRMRKVSFIDSTGLHNLESLWRLSNAEHIHMILSGVNEQVHKVLTKSGFDQKIGAENICSNINEAVAKANAAINEKRFA